ncbi:MAG TPA: hypothetical protein VFS32_08030, partial [Candidatus Limnocylindrales bacterium]|nr:hypothetical protein [Candidatus Limnocylindrales bacterium]
ILQLLARYFANTNETDAQLATLADVAVGLMATVVMPLGGLVTRLPVGAEHPGLTAGPSFELFYGVDILLPHRDAAWLVLEERMRVLADLGTRCKSMCVPQHLPTLEKVTGSIGELADRLAAAR